MVKESIIKETNTNEGDAVSRNTNKSSEIFNIIIPVILLMLIFMLGVTLRVHNLNVVHRSSDEAVYTLQSRVIAQEGVQGIRALISHYNVTEKLWIFPPPIRLGYLWVISSFMNISGIDDERAGSYLSFAFSVITLFLLIVLGLRFFNVWIMLFALLLLSVSPMDLAIARRTWQDSMVGCFGMALVYCSCELLRSVSQHKDDPLSFKTAGGMCQILWFLIFVSIGSYCILIKESGSVIYGLTAIWVLGVLCIKEKNISKSIYFILYGMLGAVIGITIFARAAGGINNILTVLRHVKDAMPTNAYAIKYQTGPWYNLIYGLWLLSPASTLLYFVGIFSAVLRKDLKEKTAVFGLIFFVVTLMTITSLTPYCQNIRYISALYGPFYLIAGFGVWNIMLLISSLLKKVPFWSIILIFMFLVCSIAVYDYRNFEKVFIRTEIADVSIRLVREFS
jgi:hypothetical protein